VIVFSHQERDEVHILDATVTFDSTSDKGTENGPWIFTGAGEGSGNRQIPRVGDSSYGQVRGGTACRSAAAPLELFLTPFVCH